MDSHASLSWCSQVSTGTLSAYKTKDPLTTICSIGLIDVDLPPPPPPPVPRNCLAHEPPLGSAVEFSHNFFY